MNLPRGSRRVHYWAAPFIALPTALVIATGILLQIKKQVPWVQPAERQGSGMRPSLTLGDILTACGGVPQAKIASWDDVARVDIRPKRNLIKVTGKSGYEVQLDAASGRVLQVAYRRSDLIEDLHSGAWFHDLAKLYVFLPNGIVLFVMVVSGVYMFYLPIASRRRRRARLADARSNGTAER